MATWRDEPQWCDGYLFLLKPTPIFRAQVDEPSLSYPVAHVHYKNVTLGNASDVREGQTVVFGASSGAYNPRLGVQRIRRPASESRLKIGYSSQGKRLGELNISHNQYITVWNDYRVWSKIPRIEADGTMYKDYNIEAGEYPLNPPPVANAGVGYAGLLPTGATNVAISFSGTNSFAVASGASISGYQWEIDDGTITSGTLTSSSITATFPEGFRWVHLTVTDSNGNSHTTHVPVAVCGESLKPITQFNVRRTLNIEGQTAQFTVWEDVDWADYPEGTLVIYWEHEHYADEQVSLYGPTGREHVKFIGWLTSEITTTQGAATGTTTTVAFTAVDTAGRLAQIPGFPQAVEYKADAATWNELANANIDRYFHYLLHWHSTALEVSPFSWSGRGSEYPFPALGSDGESLYDQVNRKSEAIIYRFTCDQRGILRVEPDLNLQEVALRRSDVIQNLTESDFSAIEVSGQYHPRYHWLDSTAVKARSDKIKAIWVKAPGKTPGQGAQPATQNYRLVKNAAEFTEQEGHRYAQLNSDWDLITLTLVPGNDGGIDPARMQWVTLTVAEVPGYRNRSLTTQRCLVQSLDITYNSQAGTKLQQLTVEVEVIGTAAVVHKEPEDDISEPPPTDDDETPPIDPPDDPPQTSKNVVVLIDNLGQHYKTTEFEKAASEGGPYWKRVSLGVTGTVLRFIEDPFSPYLTTGAGYLNGWVLTSSRLYYVSDLRGSPSAALRYTFPEDVLGRSLAVSKREANFLVVASHIPVTGGCIATMTTSGTTFASATVTVDYDSDTGSIFCPAVAISDLVDGLVYVSASTIIGTGAAQSGSTYISENHGFAWALLEPSTTTDYRPDITSDNEMSSDVVIPATNNPGGAEVYYGAVKWISSETNTKIITFDGDGFTGYQALDLGNDQLANSSCDGTPYPESQAPTATFSLEVSGDNTYYQRKITKLPDRTQCDIGDNVLFDISNNRLYSPSILTVEVRFATPRTIKRVGMDYAAQWALQYTTPESGSNWAQHLLASIELRVEPTDIETEAWQWLKVEVPSSTPSGNHTLGWTTFLQDITDVPNIKSIRWNIKVHNIFINFSSGTYFSALGNYVRLDNLLWEDNESGGGSTEKIRRLYRSSSRIPYDKNISPLNGPTSYGPDNARGGGQIVVSNKDEDTLLLVGANYERDEWGVWASTDAGDTWAMKTFGTDIAMKYRRGRNYATSKQRYLLFGTDGAIAYTSNLGGTIEDKRGNIASMASPGEIVGAWVED